MEDRDANKGLRSSWEDVYKMPDKADAAQQDCKQRQAVSEADSPKKDQAGQLRCCTLLAGGCDPSGRARVAKP